MISSASGVKILYKKTQAGWKKWIVGKFLLNLKYKLQK